MEAGFFRAGLFNQTFQNIEHERPPKKISPAVTSSHTRRQINESDFCIFTALIKRSFVAKKGKRTLRLTLSEDDRSRKKNSTSRKSFCVTFSPPSGGKTSYFWNQQLPMNDLSWFLVEGFELLSSRHPFLATPTPPSEDLIFQQIKWIELQQLFSERL